MEQSSFIEHRFRTLPYEKSVLGIAPVYNGAFYETKGVGMVQVEPRLSADCMPVGDRIAQRNLLYGEGLYLPMAYMRSPNRITRL